MLKVRSASKKFATSLISSGKINTDGAWKFTAADGNKLLGKNGDNWENYGKYFLAEDTEAEEETKVRYKYPFGKDGEIYRRGVIAIKSRAAQQEENSIMEAADALLVAINKKLGLDEDDGDPDSCPTKKKKSMDGIEDRVSRVDYLPFPDEENYMSQPMKVTEDGLMKGRAILTNVGVFVYILEDGSTRRELRPPEEVFSYDSIESLKMLPLTNNHPKEAVTVDNVKKYQVGFVGDSILQDQYHLSGPVTITDGEAIGEVQGGKRGISCGYRAKIEFSSGTWCGSVYDAIQRDIRYNHVAIVDKGRAGDDARFKLDHRFDGVAVVDENNNRENVVMAKIIIDGVEYEVDKDIARQIHTLNKQVEDQAGEIETLKADKNSLSAEKDTLAGKLDTANESLKDLEGKKFTEDEIDKRVQDRLDLLASAKLAEVEVKDGMEGDELKKTIILKAFPKSDQAKLDGGSAEYLNARFDGAVEFLQERGEAQAQQRKDSFDPPLEDKNQVSSAKARQNMANDMADAWKRDKE